MTEYRLARPQEGAAVLDFINMVFSMHAQPHDFAAPSRRAISARLRCTAIHAARAT